MMQLRSFVPAFVAALALAACGDAPKPATIGDAQRGQLLLHQYPCADCHVIPDVPNARGKAGPPLDGVARRAYLAGALPNTPEHMAQWIRNPQKFKPRTDMPNLHVPEQHANDMVAYLYGQR